MEIRRTGARGSGNLPSYPDNVRRLATAVHLDKTDPGAMQRRYSVMPSCCNLLHNIPLWIGSVLHSLPSRQVFVKPLLVMLYITMTNRDM